MIIKDLSQTYANGMPHALTIPKPSFHQVKSVRRNGISVTQLSVATHVGTHIDAPAHVIEGGQTVDQLPFSLLIGPAMVLSCEKAANTAITGEDLASTMAVFSPGDALLIRTGWGEKFGTSAYYEHPYLSEDAAQWIVDQQFRLVGVDFITPEMPSPLRSRDFDFPVHHILLENGVLVIEHLFLEKVVGRRFQLFIGALKIASADGAPARILALLE